MSLLSLAGLAQIRDRTQHTDQPPPSQSQSSAKKNKRGPRAIAVVEFLPGGGTRLVPIALWIDDRFYDASLYGSNPEPMALQPETLYEATDYGEPAGFFTVTTPKEINGNWVGDGQWKPRRALDEQLARQAAKQPKPKASASGGDDDRPILRRGGTSGPSSSSDSPANAGSTAGSSDSPASNPTPGDSDPDRPTLKKPSPPPAASSSAAKQADTAQTAAPSSPDENDPNRPILRRGNSAPQASAPAAGKIAPSKSPSPANAAPAKLVTPPAQIGRKSFPAVSDAGAYETRSLLYAMNSVERTERSRQMLALAMDEIRKFIGQRKAPPLPKTATITDYDLRAFDLDYSNSPTLVLNARLPVETAKSLRGGPFDYFVTVVAREDINGTPIKIFSSVTDSNHLDAFARMEIIDAVDADANGRGDLLFRLYSDVAISYGLYRIHPYEMQKIFEGGSGI